MCGLVGKREHGCVQRTENGSEPKKEHAGSRAEGACEGCCLLHNRA